MASRASPSRLIQSSVPFVHFSPLETAEQNGAKKKQRRACLQKRIGGKLRCQDVGKGYSTSFSLLTGGEAKPSQHVKNSEQKSRKIQHSNITEKAGHAHRALLVSNHSSSSQSQQVRHAAQVLVR